VSSAACFGFDTLKSVLELGVKQVLNINKLWSGAVLGIVAIWIVAIALLSVQNATLVSLKFLLWQTVPLPAGLLLAIGLSGGILLGGSIPGWQRRR
jgi:lipopolysaccharide assembly protein A